MNTWVNSYELVSVCFFSTLFSLTSYRDPEITTVEFVILQKMASITNQGSVSSLIGPLRVFWLNCFLHCHYISSGWYRSEICAKKTLNFSFGEISFLQRMYDNIRTTLWDKTHVSHCLSDQEFKCRKKLEQNQNCC